MHISDNDYLAAYVMGQLPGQDATLLEQEAATNAELACKLFVMQIMCGVPPMFASDVESLCSPERDLPISETVDKNATTNLQTTVRQAIQQALAPYRTGKRPVSELHNRDLAEHVLQQLSTKDEFHQVSRLQLFLIIGEVIADEFAHSARHALIADSKQSREGVSEVGDTAIASCDETTIALAVSQPQRVLDRDRRLMDLRELQKDHGQIYLLSMFAGRSNQEIAELFAWRLSDVAEALECATVEVQLEESGGKMP